MFRLLFPLLGCGLMMVICMALMGAAGHRRPPADDPSEVASLRAEVDRLRRLVDERDDSTPTPG
jgi:hypothetical protein